MFIIDKHQVRTDLNDIAAYSPEALNKTCINIIHKGSGLARSLVFANENERDAVLAQMDRIKNAMTAGDYLKMR